MFDIIKNFVNDVYTGKDESYKQDVIKVYKKNPFISMVQFPDNFDNSYTDYKENNDYYLETPNGSEKYFSHFVNNP